MLLQMLRNLRQAEASNMKDDIRSVEGIGGGYRKSQPGMAANGAVHVRAGEQAGLTPTTAANGDVTHAPAPTINGMDEAALRQLLQMQLRQISSGEVDQESEDTSQANERSGIAEFVY